MNAVTVGAALSLLEKGEGFAWLTIIDNLGSSPRHVGSAMLVRADGSIAGTIGGGALEGAAIRAAAQAIEARESRLMDYNLTNSDSAKLGMICGGTGVVLVDYVDPANESAESFYSALLELVESGRKGWIVIALPQEPAPGWTARNCLVRADGTVAGDPVCSREDLQELVKKGGSRDGLVTDGSARTFVQPIGLQGAAYVFGAGHCGEKLVPVLNSIGFYTVVVDDRAEFANSMRFPSADRIVVPDSFDAIVQQLPIDEDSYVVIVTRGHVHDRSILGQALRTDAAYVGMIGSRKKVAETFRALTEEGVPTEAIARVHAPIGLPIGAETPEEIAVSIAAELIQIRASRRR